MSDAAESKPPRADWLAWVLHGLWGAVPTGLTALVITGGKLGRSSGVSLFTRDEARLLIRVGAVLFGMGLGSAYGERLWGHPAKAIFRRTPEGFNQSPRSRAVSIFLMLIGALLMIAGFGVEIALRKN